MTCFVFLSCKLELKNLKLRTIFILNDKNRSVCQLKDIKFVYNYMNQINRIKMFYKTLLLSVLSVSAFASEHTDEADYLMQSYLKNNNFVEKLPDYSDGKAMGVHKSMSTHFSINGQSSIKGNIQIKKISGRFRLPLAKTDNISYQHKQIKVNATIKVHEGVLKIYNPVDINFWNMAKLFVSHPDRKSDDVSKWQLKGFVEKTIDSSKSVTAQVSLLAIGNGYYLLLASEDSVSGVEIELK